jgi:hypothetical protein
MALRPHRRSRPRPEWLEARIALSLPPGTDTYGLTPPANTIGLSLGNASRPGTPSATTVTISPLNITPGKASTEFAVFVRPYVGSGIVPQIVGVDENGKRLPVQYGRSYTPRLAGQSTNQSVAFFETGQPGTVTILVEGRGLSTGAYTVETTLPGDVNGDGQVNLADGQAFALAYATKPGEGGGTITSSGRGSTGGGGAGGGTTTVQKAGYNPAADYNQNGVVNLYDALALERNMTPLRKPGGGWVAINLAPNEQINFAGSKNSGGTTFDEKVNINGYTTPGSIVLVDSKLGDYTFASQALSTDANGFFTVKATNTSGINTFNFKVLDPFGHQYIRSFPVFWIPYAVPNSMYHYKPSKKTSGLGKI